MLHAVYLLDRNDVSTRIISIFASRYNYGIEGFMWHLVTALRSEMPQRQRMEEGRYQGFVYTTSSLIGVAIADLSYPTMAGYGLLYRIITSFLHTYPSWRQSLPGNPMTDELSLIFSMYSLLNRRNPIIRVQLQN